MSVEDINNPPVCVDTLSTYGIWYSTQINWSHPNFLLVIDQFRLHINIYREKYSHSLVALHYSYTH